MPVSNPEVEAGDKTDGIIGYKKCRVSLKQVWLAYSREFKVLDAMLTVIDLIARYESGCQPPRVDRGNMLHAPV